MKPAREPASSRPKPCAFLKKPHESCPFAAPCGPRRKKNDRGQRSAFPSETSRFKPVILAHRGSALPWLVNDRAALRLRRIWCLAPLNRHTPSRQSPRVYRVVQLRTAGGHCRESAGTGPVNLRVVPNKCCLGRSSWINEYAHLFPKPTIGMKWAC